MKHQIWLENNLNHWVYLLPELFLLGGAFLMLTLSAWSKLKRPWALALGLGIFSSAFACGLYASSQSDILLFSNLLQVDSLVHFSRPFFILCSAIASLFIFQAVTFSSDKKFLETLAFLMVITVGFVFMSMSVDLLMVILSIEMVSILSYLLVARKPNDAFSSEAGLKYILFGAVASGIMMFGFSFIFGLTGSSFYDDMMLKVHSTLQPSEYILLFFGLVSVLIGFGFKMTTFPTQMWAPDVYQGAPTSITAFLSVSSKAAGFLIFIRLLVSFRFQVEQGISQITELLRIRDVLVVFGLFSMLIGNVSALRQKNIKRMMAYSSIAHAGFLLLGLSVLNRSGLEAVIFYLMVYAATNLGTFYIIHLRVLDTGNDHIDSFRGYGNQNIWMAVAMSGFLISLIGLPPFGGFIAKFYIFKALLMERYFMTALFAAINSVIAVYYYMNIIKWMFFKEGNDPEYPRYPAYGMILILALSTVTWVMGIYWWPFTEIASRAIRSFF